mmetsp:Transcript_143215/g.457626  ORF Transcript_143215/g.457626 Transcript_143215/m.457626 type:complete len:272 (+) Transcript_143215:810-1625(+)
MRCRCLFDDGWCHEQLHLSAVWLRALFDHCRGQQFIHVRRVWCWQVLGLGWAVRREQLHRLRERSLLLGHGLQRQRDLPGLQGGYQFERHRCQFGQCVHSVHGGLQFRGGRKHLLGVRRRQVRRRGLEHLQDLLGRQVGHRRLRLLHIVRHRQVLGGHQRLCREHMQLLRRWPLLLGHRRHCLRDVPGLLLGPRLQHHRSELQLQLRRLHRRHLRPGCCRTVLELHRRQVRTRGFQLLLYLPGGQVQPVGLGFLHSVRRRHRLLLWRWVLR